MRHSLSLASLLFFGHHGNNASPIVDIGTDIATTVVYFKTGNNVWGGLSVAYVVFGYLASCCLPCFGDLRRRWDWRRLVGGTRRGGWQRV